VSTWLAGFVPRWFTCPWTVTHPSTNRARRRVTSLIEHNALPLRHATPPTNQQNMAFTDQAKTKEEAATDSVVKLCGGSVAWLTEGRTGGGRESSNYSDKCARRVRRLRQVTVPGLSASACSSSSFYRCFIELLVTCARRRCRRRRCRDDAPPSSQLNSLSLDLSLSLSLSVYCKL